MALKKACTTRTIEVTHADLPIACPPLDDRVWDAHPRVYLSLPAEGRVACPYCGTLFLLKDACHSH